MSKTVTVGRHGDFPWTKLYTLEEAARVIDELSESTKVAVAEVVNSLAHPSPSTSCA